MICCNKFIFCIINFATGKLRFLIILLLILPFGHQASYSQYTVLPMNHDSLLQLLTTSAEKDKGDIYLNLALYWFGEKNYTESRKYCKMAIGIFNNYNDQPSLYLCIDLLIEIYFTNNDLKSADDVVEGLLDEFKYLKNASLKAHIYRAIGNYYIRRYQFDKGIECVNKATRIISDTNYSQLYFIFNLASDAYFQLREYSKALEYQKKSLKVATILEDSTRITGQLNEIGMSFQELMEYDSASYYFNRALTTSFLINDLHYASCILDNMAEIQFTLLHYDSALVLFNRALKIRYEINYIWGIGNTSTNIGRVLLATKKYTEAEPYLKTGEEWLMKCHDRNYANIALNRNYISQAKLFEQTNHPAKALEYIKKHIAVRDTLLSQEIKMKYAELETKYESDKKDSEIQYQHLLLNQRERQLILVFIIGMVILISGVLLVLMIVRNKKQKEKLLNADAENLRKELELKNRELVCNVSNIYTKNLVINKVARTLSKSAANFKQSNMEIVRNIISELKQNMDETGWKEFEYRFAKVHESFYVQLDTKFPDLTSTERKVCAMLKLNMSSKEIASITMTRSESVDTTRSRIRKKLGINHDENLTEFLNNF
nr:hypothetical protein [Bacteroidota bacterium]